MHIDQNMAAGRRSLLPAVCALLIVMTISSAGSSELEGSSVVVGLLVKCADCTGKNMRAEAAFNGLQVVIKCKNSKGDYESKAVGKLGSTGALSVPLATDHDSTDCLAQLHSVAGAPCSGQEPSRIVPQSDGTMVVIPGKTNNPSVECASATICGPIKKHFLDQFHKKPVPPKPKPEPKPQPVYRTPTPTYVSPTPIYHPPQRHLFDKKHRIDHFHKDQDHHHFFYHPPQRHLFDKKHWIDHFHKDQDHHHFFDHFHKKPMPPKSKPEPKPQPEYHPPTPTYGSPSSIYHPPARHLFDKKALLDHLHKDHDHHHHFFDHFHKKPDPPKPKPEPKPQPDYHPPTPTYVSPTPIYHPPSEQLFDKKHFLDHFHKGHDHDHFHKKPVPPKPKLEPKPKQQPEHHPATPTYSSPTPIYHPPAKH